MRLIDADALCKDLLERWSVAETRKEELVKAVMADIVTPIIILQPTIEPEPHWIPFKHRKPTEEEGTAFDYIMDCKCPEDGQNILVSINIQGHEPVQYDTFYGGGGEECCLESGYELVEEATAWMPLPEDYKGEE